MGQELDGFRAILHRPNFSLNFHLTDQLAQIFFIVYEFVD